MCFHYIAGVCDEIAECWRGLEMGVYFEGFLPVFEFSAAANLGIGALSQQLERAFDGTLARLNKEGENFSSQRDIDLRDTDDRAFFHELMDDINEFALYVRDRKQALQFWHGWCLAGFAPSFLVICYVGLFPDTVINNRVSWIAVIVCVAVSVGPFLSYFSSYFLAFLKGKRFDNQLESIERRIFNYLREKRGAQRVPSSRVVFSNGILAKAGQCGPELLLAKPFLEGTSSINDPIIHNSKLSFRYCNEGDKFCMDLRCGKTARLTYSVGSYDFYDIE